MTSKHTKSVVIIDQHASVTGGATRVAVDEAVGLAAAGISVSYLAALGPICDELIHSKIRVILLDQKQLIEARRNPSVLLHSLWNRTAYHAMDELLTGLDPKTTLVHVHSFSQTISGSPVRCALDRNYSVISTLHDYFTCCPNGGFFDYRTKQVCDRRPLSLSCVVTNCDKRNYAHKLYRLINTQARHVLGKIPSGIENYISVSRSSVRRIRPYLPRDATIFSLPSPCLVERAPPAPLYLNKSVAVIGRLSPEKGIEILIDAARRTGTSLLFIGDGPLRTDVEVTGMHRVTGWLPRSEVYSLLDEVRCLALPSLVPETFGLSVIDAAARGIPSIVTEVCGAVEWIDHGKTGWQVPPGNVSAFASCLNTIKNTDVVTAVGMAAYEKYWHSPCSQTAHIESLIQIYDSVLRNR